MHNSKSKYIRAIVFILLFALANEFLLLALNDDISMRTNIWRCTNTRYEDVFIGTSQCRAGTNPSIIEQYTNKSATNCSIPLSSPLDQYYLVKEITRSGNKPERIIYECDPYYFSEAKAGGHSYAYPIGRVRAEYTLASMKQDWRIVLCHWAFHLGNYYRMPEILASKIKYFTEGPSHKFNGYQIAGGPFHGKTIVDKRFEVSHSADRYIRELGTFCQEEGIELVLVYFPVSGEVYDGLEPVYRKGADAYFKDLSEDFGIKYINCNEWSQDRFDDSLQGFIDMEGHMNKETSEAFSRDLGAILNEK